MQDRLARFEWDEKKAERNYLKHGVLFEDAALTFFDKDFIRMFDQKHSEIEDRFVGIGAHPTGALLVTVYTERDDNLRLISSRKANKKERKAYEDLKV
jgi:uncharacterized DUF497 family protein